MILAICSICIDCTRTNTLPQSENTNHRFLCDEDQSLQQFLLCLMGETQLVRDTDSKTCTTVGSHKRPVVHYRANGQRERSYNLVREELCVHEPWSLTSTHADWTMDSAHIRPGPPIFEFHPFPPLSYHLDFDIPKHPWMVWLVWMFLYPNDKLFGSIRQRADKHAHAHTYMNFSLHTQNRKCGWLVRV